MANIQINVGSDLAAILQSLNQPMEQSARQLMVLELYRRRALSSGKAAELLGMSRWDFIHYASQLGIPFFEMTEDEWAAEAAATSKL